MFSTICAIIGLLANLIAIIQGVKNKNKPDEEQDNTAVTVLVVIGVVAIIIALFAFFMPSVDESKKTNTDNVVSKQSYTQENTYSEQELNASEIYKEVQEKTGKVWIEDVQVLAYDDGGYNNYSFKDNVLINTGEYVEHALVFDSTDFSYAEFQSLDLYLNKKYKVFDTIVGLSDDTKDTRSKFVVSIQLDGETKSEFVIERGFLPKNINLDLTDVDLMRIKITNDSPCLINGSDTDIVFGNAYFTTKKY